MANKNDEENLYLKKLKEFEQSQKEIDLIFAEYCYFHTDPICYEEVEQNIENNDQEITPDDEIIISSSNQGEIFYTTANVNLREKPSTKSQVIKLIAKDEPIKIYMIASENQDWFYAEYDNLRGYVYSKFISKEKMITSKKGKIPKKDKINNQSNNQNNLETEKRNCYDLYSGIESNNTKDAHDQFCNCSIDDMVKVTTQQDIDYIDKYGEESEEYIDKIDEVIYNCADKINYIIEPHDDDQKFIDEQILSCKQDYNSQSALNKNDYNNWCTCYHNKLLYLITKEDTDYYEKYNEWGQEFINKENDLADACISLLN